MKDIHKLGLRGRLPTFIESFLADRTMQLRVGSTLCMRPIERHLQQNLNKIEHWATNNGFKFS